jgi:hypothetical protein
MEDKIYQEFFCPPSGGGCNGYIVASLNMNINWTVEVVCPKCKHRHRRMIKNGVLCESGRFTNGPVEEICPTMAAWSKKPKTKLMNKKTGKTERDAVVINGKGREFLAERWFELHGGKI